MGTGSPAFLSVLSSSSWSGLVHWEGWKEKQFCMARGLVPSYVRVLSVLDAPLLVLRST